MDYDSIGWPLARIVLTGYGMVWAIRAGLALLVRSARGVL